jgi:hypothetical protein
MKYIDTSSRDPGQAVGAWLADSIDETIAGIRWATGFFAADVLGYFAPAIPLLRRKRGVVRLLVGSNDGLTARSDIEALLAIIGDRWDGVAIGVVKFDNAYFHPKTLHITRDDGSSTAYVGSANVTASGITGKHVEAGVLIDTRLGDEAELTTAVADAIDRWFAEHLDGLYLVENANAIDDLVRDGILNVPRPVMPRSRRRRGVRERRGDNRLAPLVELPPLPEGVVVAQRPTVLVLPPEAPALQPQPAPPVATTPATWSKRLTRSDAQRKRTGNQRGSITLVQQGQQIDAQRYFRFDLFGDSAWTEGMTRTGAPREMARIPMDVTFLGDHLGILELDVSYARNREAAQRNYTSLLHLGPLGPHFMRVDVESQVLRLSRSEDGTFSLSIGR